jgi:ketosteroid isomerase-like protein
VGALTTSGYDQPAQENHHMERTPSVSKLSAAELIDLVENRYFHNVDNKNLEPVVDCFSENAQLRVETAKVEHVGHDAIRRMFGDFMRDTPTIYHGEFSHVVDVENQLIASQFLARNNYDDGSEVKMNNCNFFVVENGRFARVTVYMSDESPLV